jgi:hypothetical protein
MAFPGELNINYYKGDTYEFNITPKKNDGTSFDLSGYNVKFNIAEQRDPVSNSIEGRAIIDTATNSIQCAILPGNGDAMTSGVSYVYDVEIKNSSGSYPKVYTILTGTISVTGQVTL